MNNLSIVIRDAFRARQHLHYVLPRTTTIPIRTKYYHNRHRDPKYRTERARKIWPVDLPDFDQIRKDEAELSPDEIRSKMKEKGIAPPSPWDEREMYSPSTMSVIEPYEIVADEKSSSLLNKIKSPISSGTELFKTRRNLSLIKSYEGEDFDLKDFAKRSVDIYIKAHEALVNREEEKIFEYVTEHCYPVITNGIKQNTLIWKFIDNVEPPQVVRVRVADLVSKGNKYAQITVRLHMKQIMAVYDRHGRLILGSPDDVKETIEYVVYEKYLANEYGQWRIHDKLKSKDQDGEMEKKKLESTTIKFTTSPAHLKYKASANFYGGDDRDLPKSHNYVIASTGIFAFFYLIFLREEDDSDGGLFQPVHETVPELAIPIIQAAIVENRKFGHSTKKLEDKLAELMKEPEKHGMSKPKLVEN